MDIQKIKYVTPAGVVLWEEPMMFSRLYAVGDPICEKSEWYVVRNVEIVEQTQVVTVDHEQPQSN